MKFSIIEADVRLQKYKAERPFVSVVVVDNIAQDQVAAAEPELGNQEMNQSKYCLAYLISASYS